MTISHFITVHFITLAWWSFILAQVPISGEIVEVKWYFTLTGTLFIRR